MRLQLSCSLYTLRLYITPHFKDIYGKIHSVHLAVKLEGSHTAIFVTQEVINKKEKEFRLPNSRQMIVPSLLHEHRAVLSEAFL